LLFCKLRTSQALSGLLFYSLPFIFQGLRGRSPKISTLSSKLTYGLEFAPPRSASSGRIIDGLLEVFSGSWMQKFSTDGLILPTIYLSGSERKKGSSLFCVDILIKTNAVLNWKSSYP